jgi:hypothetical protein
VGLTALAQPAQSEVVVTKKTIPINVFTPALLDFNNDGVADFKFSSYGMNYDHSVNNSFRATPLVSGAVVGAAGGTRGGLYASALMRGASVGPSAHFVGAKNQKVILERFYGFESASDTSKLYGKWGNVGPDRFVGLKFKIDGQTHFGWVRITLDIVRINGLKGATITAYAYETIPDKKIVVGSTTESATASADASSRASLGMLAAGADGQAIWKSEPEEQRK